MDGSRRTMRCQNVAMIPSVKTLADSKLGVDLFRGSASLELYRSSFLQVTTQRLLKRFIYFLLKEDEYMTIYMTFKPQLLIGLLLLINS